MQRILGELRENQNIRTNLSDLRKAIKEEAAKIVVLKEVQQQEALYLGFLQSEDAKTRKNAALLLGDLEYQNAAPLLYDTYVQETTLFVRAAYLQALANLNVEDKLAGLKGQLQKLQQQEIDFNNYAAQKQQEINEEQMVMMNQLGDAIQTFINNYNEEKQYAMILTNSGGAPVITADANLDITDAVLAGLNEEYIKTKNQKSE